jgi:hypothetical protein
MGRLYEALDEQLAAWISAQPLFFVGTAPLSCDGHVNISPKGPIGTFAVLGPRRVAYLDFFGSGAETIAHLRENARIVVMLCAFSGPPRILRLHGTGKVIWSGDPRFEELLDQAGFEGLTEVMEARRAIVEVEIERIAQSCGYGVPLMEQIGEREHFDKSKRKRLRTLGSDGMTDFQAARNAQSIDGLSAVPEPAPASTAQRSGESST